MYHNVVSEQREDIISAEEFERHMEYIKGRTTYKMEDLEKAGYRLDRNSALVTFDDGFRNNYTEVFPILKKHNVKATVFLNTKYIGKDSDYMNWDEIREMYGSGLVDFQLHTHSHEPVIRKPEVKSFFNEKTSDIIKREYFSLYRESFLKEKKDKSPHGPASSSQNQDNPEKEKYDFRNFDYDGLPIFKIRSRIAIRGLRPRENFIEKYRKVRESGELKRLSPEEMKRYLGKMFSENRNEWFSEITEEEFLKNMEYEILENKRMIEKNLNKKAEYLAFPWGHRYDRKKIEKLGVKGFVFTSEKFNRTDINYRKINRFNGDDIRNYSLFVEKIGKA